MYGFVWSFAFMVWILYLPLIAISPFISSSLSVSHKGKLRETTRELIFGLLEGLSLTSLISYSPSNSGKENRNKKWITKSEIRKINNGFSKSHHCISLKISPSKHTKGKKSYSKRISDQLMIQFIVLSSFFLQDYISFILSLVFFF